MVFDIDVDLGENVKRWDGVEITRIISDGLRCWCWVGARNGKYTSLRLVGVWLFRMKDGNGDMVVTDNRLDYR